MSITNRKKDFIFNTLGGFIYALNSVILLMIVVQTLGAMQGGIFSIAYTISQTVCIIGLFEMRVFQVIDNGKHLFQDFFLSRIFTSILMVLASVIWIIYNSYSVEKSLVIFLLCLYRLSDCFGDVIEGYYQQHNKLYLSGIFLAIRSGIPALIFAFSLIISSNLIISSLLLVFTSLFLLIIIDIFAIHFKEKEKLCGGSFSQAFSIIKFCFPLFLSTFFSTYILNAPKYAIDKYGDEQTQTFYSIIFMPSYMINLFSGFIFKPFLLDFVNLWAEKQLKQICRLVAKMTFIITLLTLSALLLGWFWGIPVLSAIYGVSSLISLRPQLFVILLGGGFCALSAFLYHLLVVLGEQKKIFISYFLVFLESLILSNLLVGYHGISGAAFAYLIYMFSLTSIFFLITLVKLYKHSKNKEF